MAIASIIVYPNFYLAIHNIIDSLEMQFFYFAKKNKEKIIEPQPDAEIRNNIFISTDKYINLIGNNGNWAIDIDIYVSSIIFGINIVVYKNIESKDNIEYLSSFYADETNENIPLLLLSNENNNHFNLIIPADNEINNFTHSQITNNENNKALNNNNKLNWNNQKNLKKKKIIC